MRSNIALCKTLIRQPHMINHHAIVIALCKTLIRQPHMITMRHVNALLSAIL
jgi:hypothetical protein